MSRASRGAPLAGVLGGAEATGAALDGVTGGGAARDRAGALVPHASNADASETHAAATVARFM
jgi:hypothetical protein